MHRINVPVVVNTGCGQVLVVTEIPLSHPAIRIKQVDKEVLIRDEDCKVIRNKVIINGILRKSIVFLTAETCNIEPCGCEELRRVCGDVRHCTVDIPFHLFIVVPGAREGDKCVIEDAFVEGEHDELLDCVESLFKPKDKCENEEPKPIEAFRRFREKAVVRVEVRVVHRRHLDVDNCEEATCEFETDEV